MVFVWQLAIMIIYSGPDTILSILYKQMHLVLRVQHTDEKTEMERLNNMSKVIDRGSS